MRAIEEESFDVKLKNHHENHHMDNHGTSVKLTKLGLELTMELTLTLKIVKGSPGAFDTIHVHMSVPGAKKNLFAHDVSVYDVNPSKSLRFLESFKFDTENNFEVGGGY